MNLNDLLKMDYTYTYATPPCRERRHKNIEFGIFKMATICGYPGASTRWLPFTHKGFPASSTLPSPRSYTFCPKREQTSVSVMSKKTDDSCKAVVCYQERDVIELPKIFRPAVKRKAHPPNENAYVNKNKVCFKLKGINPKSAYSANRSKPNISTPYRHSLECLRINSNRSSSLMELAVSDPWNAALESIAKATLQGTNAAQDRDWEKEELREPSPITIAMRKKFEEERRYMSSGMKGKKLKDGRPLGHLVSPGRMNSFLLQKEKTEPNMTCKTDIAKES